jgi:predicted O-linked N-acetylglucosamine transferase (SPINDLY family)/glycosyltransferase involved in cell wall biosynthesis
MTRPKTVEDRSSADEPSRPLFSVIWYGRNLVDSARETIAALQAQTCGEFELIVEDCGSTDGSLELFEAAAKQDPRIRIFRRWTMRAGDALLSAFRRCRGDYIAVCPNEGHFLPEALQFAAKSFAERPAMGALCSEGFLIDATGKSIDHVDIVSLLLTSHRPFLPAGFFRRRTLVATGLRRDGWFTDSFDLDLCYRLAAESGLASIKKQVVVCRDPQRQVEGLNQSVDAAIDDRLRLISKIFSRDGFFGSGHEPVALESSVNQLSIVWEEFRTRGQPEVEFKITRHLATAALGLHLQLRIDHRTLRSLHRLLCMRSHNLGLLSPLLQRLLALTTRLKGRLPIHIGYAVWNLPLWGYWLKRKIILLTLPASEFHPAAPPRDSMFADLYALAGERYEARGQIDLAIEMWDRVRPPDETIDSLACQAMLKSPAATDATLADRQREWVRHHLGERPAIGLPRSVSRKNTIRVGYFCAFMDSDTMRNMMGNVIAAHDRRRFEIYGYSPHAVPADIRGAFDLWRLIYAASTGGANAYTDEQFAELIRSDRIDVFVELTGFSPGNRFGAMSLRCAPVQVSFMNHTGTSQVPNVDYILSDEICIPSGSDSERHYSETIYRLPGSFFCFDYTKSNEPPIVGPPFVRNGHITFGCFGTGGKIGIELIELWAKLLHRVPGSLLHIQNPQLSLAGNREFMADRFRRFGISSDRLVLESGVSRPELLQVYGLVDVSLDTWPYCGGNTIAESLWHGVPVVTLKGDRFSSRYGASLLAAAGCDDLIAQTPEQYVCIAARLANDPERLRYLRSNLRRMSFEHGLGNSKAFARKLESAFISMLKEYSRKKGSSSWRTIPQDVPGEPSSVTSERPVSPDAGQPLVSVICFCKDRVSFMSRAVESVLNQTYRNIELVVQDGASTDGTLELLRSYAQRDPRVKIVSEPDSGPTEAFWKVLHRCNGDFIATCLSDEELFPNAIEKAVGWFAAAPDVGAFTCDGYTTDSDGHVTGEFNAGDFDFIAYLFGRYSPFWPGSFFRRQALLDIGLNRAGWNLGCLEFEIWCRLARDHEVQHVAERVAKYAVHPGQLSNTPADFFEHVEERLQLIEDMFSADGFFGEAKSREMQAGIDLRYDIYRDHWFWEIECQIDQLSQFAFHARAHRLHDAERELTRRLNELKMSLIDLYEHNIEILKLRNPSCSPRQVLELVAADLWPAWEAVVGIPARAEVSDASLRRKLLLHRTLTEQVLIRLDRPLERAVRLAERLGLSKDSSPEFKKFAEDRRETRLARIYDATARIYEARGQISQALAMWRHAEALGDRNIDSHAVQSALKGPDETDASLADRYRDWVRRHLGNPPEVRLVRPAAPNRKMRIGYHCSFMDSDTVRNMMGNVIAAHDRDRFEIYGYAPQTIPAETERSFNVFRVTRAPSDSGDQRYTDEEFASLVRADGIDVFVELTGFSPGNRFGAMSLRCAPVQVTSLNHTGSSQVPNVDYVLSDEICTPSHLDAQRHYSERIYRLPSCFFCFDYTNSNEPPIVDPPSMVNNFVTFGCFGSANKINTRVVEWWSDLMRRVPRSKILLQHAQLNPSDNRRYMIDRFARFGIAPDRVILRQGTDRAGTLKAYSEVDISLDTWPYCGGNTIAESLWHGVPVITYKGDRFASAYGASLLTAAGCTDFIAKTPEHYVDIGVRLANDPDLLLELRRNLRKMFVGHGLGDSRAFARALEDAFMDMLERAQS